MYLLLGLRFFFFFTTNFILLMQRNMEPSLALDIDIEDILIMIICVTWSSIVYRIQFCLLLPLAILLWKIGVGHYSCSCNINAEIVKMWVCLTTYHENISSFWFWKWEE